MVEWMMQSRPLGMPIPSCRGSRNSVASKVRTVMARAAVLVIQYRITHPPMPMGWSFLRLVGSLGSPLASLGSLCCRARK